MISNLKLLVGLGLGNLWSHGEQMIEKILTYALVFKPKKLQHPWEHKNGFFVYIQADTALRIIENAKAERKRNRVIKKNHCIGMDRDLLLRRISGELNIIQSSQNNYVDFFCVVGGSVCGVFLIQLIPQIWGGAGLLHTRIFLITMLFVIICIALYFYKRKIDQANIDYFLDLEDALYFHEYGESYYK